MFRNLIANPFITPPIRYAIAGAGGFGACRRAMVREAGGFEIVGALDPSDDAMAKPESEEGKVLRRYQTMRELCADPAVEAVFIATPAYLHLAQGWEAVRSGKAGFIEKPLGHDLEDCRRLVDYCEANHIAHGHGFSSPLKPIGVEIKPELRSWR